MRIFFEIALVAIVCVAGLLGLLSLQETRNADFEAFEREVGRALPMRTPFEKVESHALTEGWLLTHVGEAECARRFARQTDPCFGGSVLIATRVSPRPWCRYLGRPGYSLQMSFDSAGGLTARSIEDSGFFWLAAC